MSAADVSTSTVLAQKLRAWAWPGALCLLALAEFAILDSLYDVRIVGAGGDVGWLAANYVAKLLAYAGFYGLVAFALMMWPRRARWAATWVEAQRRPQRWRWWAGVNLGLFALLVWITPHISAAGAPWAAFYAWIGAVAFMLVCLAPAAAPPRFWLEFVRGEWRALLIAALVGVMVVIATALAQDSWVALAGITLRAAYALLSLAEPNAYLDTNAFLLGVGDFRVRIDSYCSGYEGVGLVLAALAVYVFMFRARLRFPNAYLLFPIGAAAILALNVVRISALVWLGGHVSPNFALKGFHSQAGWIAFIAVTGMLMAWAHSSAWFRSGAVKPAKTRDPAVTLALALLAPFALLMASRIAGAMAGDGAHWIPVVATLLPGAALWRYRDTLRAQFGPITLEPALIGLVVGGFWIATQPHGFTAGQHGWWLMAQAPALAALWFALRLIGFALIVPLAEELAFRGYLHRALMSRHFDQAAPAAFGWIAFLATSLLFGVMHGRWLAGALAGAAFALTLYRSKSMTGPVVAHAVANAAIALWALAMRDWVLL